MIQSRTTLSEISKALNVSISTVSKSLSDSPEISNPTKKRVQDFAKECNYIPNNFAANLRKGYTNTIGLIIPNILNPFYAKVLHGIENYLDENGYKLFTSISNESKEKEIKSITKMTSGYVDGVILCISKEALLSEEYEHINSLIKQEIPVVLFDRICEMVDCDKVIIDDYQTAYNVTEHLIKNKKCKNILITSLIDDLHHGKLRTKGFKDAMKVHGLNVDGKIIVSDTALGLNRKLKDVIRDDTTIEAIFGVNEQAVVQAIHVNRHLNTNGYLNDVIIAGFCDQYQADYDPSLIIVNQNAEKIGAKTAKLILKRIKSTEKRDSFIKTIDTYLS